MLVIKAIRWTTNKNERLSNVQKKKSLFSPTTAHQNKDNIKVGQQSAAVM